MKFIDALQTGKPMRRRGTLTSGVYLFHRDGDQPVFTTVNITTGRPGVPVGIARVDYLADDWETHDA